MRKFMFTGLAYAALMLSPAFAADMALKGPPAPYPQPTSSWTGFYLGVNGGAGWGNSSSSADISLAGLTTTLPIASQGTAGWLGGVTAGYNFQAGVVVFGVEGDFDWADIEGNTSCLVVFNCNVKQDWVGDIAGRLGVAPISNLLMYVKGGVAWADTKYNFGNSFTAGVVTVSITGNASDTRTGGLLGMGAEYAFMAHWSAKIEYDFIDYGTDTVNLSLASSPAGLLVGLPPSIPTQIKETESVMKAGINYRF
jgi:outer membrane immunogenic protein